VVLRIALVASPAHDQICRLFDPDRVDVVVHADLPTLRRRVRTMLAVGEPLDVVCVHSSDIPSLSRHLLPLDGIDVHGVLPMALQLCTWSGQLMAAPRTFDTRLLWTRSDMVADVPTTWAGLEDGGASLGFAGRNPDVAQLFTEVLAEHQAGVLDRGRPALATPESVAALARMVRLARHRGPLDLPVWIDDDVENAFAAGRVGVGVMWASAWGRLSRSVFADRMKVHAPLGPACAARSLAWAVPRASLHVNEAKDLVNTLASLSGQLYDNAAGLLPANLDALIAVEGVSEPDLKRRELLEDASQHRRLGGFRHQFAGAVEQAVWPPLHAALSGDLHPGDAVHAMQQACEPLLGKARPKAAPRSIADMVA